jgi:hypothetical protein
MCNPRVAHDDGGGEGAHSMKDNSGRWPREPDALVARAEESSV